MCDVPGVFRAVSLLAAVFLTALSGPNPAVAEEGFTEKASAEEQRRATGLIQDILSPFCPGRTLASCPSGKAGEWRDHVREWVLEGRSNEAILEELQSRAPDFQLSSTPPTRWSWWGPILVLLALTVAFALGMARTLRGAPDRTEGSTGPTKRDDPDRIRLRQELEALD
ncbi:MAG: cytochrome c-type biogenesis protein CcmH [Myxococcota bacterium]